MAGTIDSITYDLIKGAVDASAARGQVISNNISNVNTPKFKVSSVKFEENLASALSGDSISMKLTNRKHIPDESNSLNGYTVVKDEKTSLRPDGNNVDIEKEMVDLASNNMYYNFLVSRLNGKISSKRHVISEGRK
ncbi:MAG: flagellar basal body rod protein FlgB [Clostridium sp.]|uniref:flagellar basal body rod protein FlgB n=1 Tax=Clostridium sp. TaxID=1506 RepID=UPI002FC727D2